ncbi:translation initiation factor eIF-2B subunit gamma-like [Xenia sp. Carnegie-2017]|uniref:translation initiation factor eIF-2B subunit gamma-like n=1 Tax=Xenia sp. Carnegie-2017 TaxID=2897299 RepID=UPI001F043F39|nr:translation initiation factor eIF-2B subunit gamma-like [Xenia sp. Carnegie-2017]
MSEFQAIVMAAGHGSRMYPLTENFPKSILPVGNLPLIWYPLNLLFTSGFQDVIVVVLESEELLISNTIKGYFKSKLQIDIIPIPDDVVMGTADSLRYIKEKIKKDVLVVSCDLIAEVKLHQMADIHRTYDATLTVLLACNEMKDNENGENQKIKRKKDMLSQRDIIGLDAKHNRLLLLDAEDDLDEKLVLHKSLFKRFPYLKIKSNLVDGHLYIIKKWVVDFLISSNNVSESLNSIKGELIPYVIKKQYRSNKKLNQEQNSKMLEEEGLKNDIYDYIESNSLHALSQTLSTSDLTCDDSIRCHCFVMENGQCLRVNTTPLYMEANRLIPKILPMLSEIKDFVHPTVNAKRSQVSYDSMVGEGSQISEKVSIKKSIIGKHVTIGDKVKIANSVIMDHVTVKDGCNIVGSVICNNALVNENCQVKDCQIGESHTLPTGSDVKGETFAKGHMNI